MQKKNGIKRKFNENDKKLTEEQNEREEDDDDEVPARHDDRLGAVDVAVARLGAGAGLFAGDAAAPARPEPGRADRGRAHARELPTDLVAGGATGRGRRNGTEQINREAT